MAEQNIVTVPFAEFENFIMNSGPKKIRQVQKWVKKQKEKEDKLALGEEVKGGRDYYDKLKSKIRDIHRSNLPISKLDKFLKNEDFSKAPSKFDHYAKNAQGYKKWIRKVEVDGIRSGSWIDWTHNGLKVRFRPDAVIKIDDVWSVSRFYMKKAALPNDRREVVLHLLHKMVADSGINGTATIIESRKNRHFQLFEPDAGALLQLEIEADYWLRLYEFFGET